MKRLSVSCVVCLILILPVFAYAYTVDIEIGEVGVARLGSAVSRAVGEEAVRDKVYETRLLPPGYAVTGYEVTWEQWAEAPAAESEGLESERNGGVESVTSGTLMGYNVMNLVVDPVRSESGRVSVLRGLRVRVDCQPHSEGLRVRRRSYLTDSHLDDVMGRALGVDVSDYGNWTLEGYREWPTDAPGPDGGVVDCVIVTSDELVDEFERLAGWHAKLGIRSAVRGLSWIYSNYTGADDAEQVRNFLRDAYENWGSVYLLIGGDATVVPIRYAWTNHYGGESIPTDFYYANLDGTWNENGNDIYGEWGDALNPGDGATFYSQLMPGRLPVRTEAEADAYVDKIIAYSTTPEPGWARKTLLLGEVIFPADWSPGDPITLNGKDICDTAATYFPAHIDTAARYQELGTMDRDICLTEFSKGHNFVILAGHGDAFRTSTGDGEPPFIFNSDFDTLSNYNKYSFFYALNCNNSAIDVDCVFRHFVINPVGGGIATYATTRYDFPNIGQYFLNEFCDYIYNRDITRFGDACALHHHDFVSSAQSRDGSVRWTMLTYLLTGDPTMHMWVDEPDTLSVSDSGAMTYDDSTYAVWVYDGGTPVEDATVVLTGERGEYGVARTDAGGMAVLEYRPYGPGSADLFASKRGYLVYEDSVNVTGAGGRCYVSSVSIDDGGTYIGNDDGEAGWGERVGLGVGLVNGGAGTISGVVGNLAAIEGCSLFVDIQMNGAYHDSLLYVGRDRTNPATMPFGVNVGDEALGRSACDYGHEVGCWLWLDGMGWHVRFHSTRDSVYAYRCSLQVHGEINGVRPVKIDGHDDLVVGSDYILLDGEIRVNDFEDGFDFAAGAGNGVVVHQASRGYGSVGAGEVVRHYDVEFTGLTGDRLGAWFEVLIEDGGSGQWFDWFRVLVRDGSLKGERMDLASLVGDSLGVTYGVRNIGSGGLRDVNGTLRAVSGIVVEDSVSAYGDLAAREYGEGDTYIVRTTGGPIAFELELRDVDGRAWTETVEIRDLLPASGLRYVVGADYIELAWDAGDTLFAGYDVFRADELGGPYVLAGMVEGYARLVDDGLASEEDYFYYVCVRDSMGNVSAPSETLEAWTGAPYQEGWPVGPTNVIYSSVCIDDLDGDGSMEIVVGSKDENVHVWEHDGTVRSGWPRPTDDMVWSSPCIANLDGDPEKEIVAGSDDGQIYGWNHDGTGIRNPDGFFRGLGGKVRGGPSVDDLDGDMDLEIIVANLYGQVYCWHHEGTGYLQPNGYWGVVSGQVYGSVALADFDNDDSLEVIVGGTGGDIHVWNHDGTGLLNPDGFFVSTNSMYGSVAIGDVENNSDLEIAMGGMFWQGIGVFDNDASFSVGWPKSVTGYVRSSPALADLDGDDKLDIIAGTSRVYVTDDSCYVYVFSHDGVLRPGWPKSSTGEFESSPVVGDIDGDGDPEILIGCTDNYLYAWHTDGTRVNGWPRYVIHEIYSTPAICDLDGDGDVEVVVGGYDGLVHVYDLSAPYDEENMEWPRHNHDVFNTQLYAGPSKSGVDDDEPGRLPATLVLMAYPSPAASHVSVRLGVPSTDSGEYRVDVFDVRGRHVRNLVSGNLEAGYHDASWDCDDKSGRRVSSGIYFVKVSGKHANLTKKLVVVR